ncbi:WGR domain-containing protein [Mesorhizobium sp. 113-3-3]
MARFYSLTIQPTLFGGASLVRNWGRIGTKGQIKIETFDEPQDVDCAFIRLERVKRRRGYVDLGNARLATTRAAAAKTMSCRLRRSVAPA